jgi:proteasome regulatory subunit
LSTRIVLAEQNSPEPPPLLELEKELTRKERQIEYLQTELRRYHNLMEELKQGMRPIGTVEDVKGDLALVRLSGGQAFQVSIPPELQEKVTADVDAVLSPTKGVIVDVVERLREPSILEYQVLKAPKVFYEDVVGLEKELHSLRQTVEWILDPEVRNRREQIIRDPRMLEDAGSVLLFGPPGTGKTYMAKAVAGTISKNGHETSFLKVESYEIVSKWLGESAKNVKGVFKLARDSAPSILFIDEADAIGRARMEATTDAGRDVQGMLNQILTELGEGFHVNKNVAVIFATNYPSVIDVALLDRIKRIIYVPPPKTREGIKKVLDFYLSKVELDPSVSDYQGGLVDQAYEEIWKMIRGRKQIYEATILERGINVRDQYVITPRDVKNVVQEAASEASYVGERYVTMDRLLPLFKSLSVEERTSRLVS